MSDTHMLRSLRDAHEAMSAMRNSINEYVPMPSLESDLLNGPETSVFCSVVAESVITAILAEREANQKRLFSAREGTFTGD